MRTYQTPFLSREDRALADRFDERLDEVTGFRYSNFAAAANLRMSARVDRLEAWRRRPEHSWRLSAVLACAAARALKRDPLMGGLFDGRDHLEVPESASLGVSVDTGDYARYLVFPESTLFRPQDLATGVDRAISDLRPVDQRAFDVTIDQRASVARGRRRWIRMVLQETQERFDYLLPAVRRRRFRAHVASRGHFCIHNIGALDVQDFKGFLRRPAIAALWALTSHDLAIPAGAGRFDSERRLPLLLVYGQELVPLDRACRFLGWVIEALEDPDLLLGDHE